MCWGEYRFSWLSKDYILSFFWHFWHHPIFFCECLTHRSQLHSCLWNVMKAEEPTDTFKCQMSKVSKLAKNRNFTLFLSAALCFFKFVACFMLNEPFADNHLQAVLRVRPWLFHSGWPTTGTSFSLFFFMRCKTLSPSLAVMTGLDSMLTFSLWGQQRFKHPELLASDMQSLVLLFSLTRRQLVFSQTHNNQQQTPLSALLVSTWCPQGSTLTLECVFNPRQRVRQRSLSDKSDIYNDYFGGRLPCLQGQWILSSEQIDLDETYIDLFISITPACGRFEHLPSTKPFKYHSLSSIFSPTI